MAISIMRNFSGYTIESIMDMPFCHFIKLYKMTETADGLSMFNILGGNAALHDDKLSDALRLTKDSRFIQPKIVFPSLSKG